MTTGKCAALLLLGPSGIAGLALGLSLLWQASPGLAFGVAWLLIALCCWLFWLLWRHG